MDIILAKNNDIMSESKNMTGENKENFEGHGNNWAAVVDDFGEQKMVEISKPIIESKESIIKMKDDFFGMIGYEPPLRVLALIKKGAESSQLYSLYPFFQINNPVEVEISEIREWSTGGEGVIEGSVAGGVGVSFFDTLYFLNKDKYQVGNTYTFNLTGLAHGFSKRTDTEMQVNKGPLKGRDVDSSRMTGFMPVREYGGEFTFYSPFESFSGSIEALGSKFYQYPFALTGLENGETFRFPLFVREQTLKGYEPELNDPLYGTGWLQGYLSGSLSEGDK